MIAYRIWLKSDKETFYSFEVIKGMMKFGYPKLRQSNNGALTCLSSGLTPLIQSKQSKPPEHGPVSS